MRHTTLVYLTLLAFLFGGCGQKDDQQDQQQPKLSVEHQENEPQAQSELTLLPVEYKELKNWYRDELMEAYPAIKYSCEQILKEKTAYLSNTEMRIPTAAYRDVCEKFLNTEIDTSAELRFFIDKYFTPYLVLDKNNPEGKFTAYYESSLEASRTQSDRYPYPIYGKPRDLIEVNIGDFDDRYPNQKIFGRIDEEKQKLVPYYTRSEIEKMDLPAPVILWANDLVDLNIMQIQGSAVAYLESGEQVRLGFAAHNGRPFTGIGSILLSQGLIDKSQASMGAIRQWLKKHPDIAAREMSKNDRYVFHRIADSLAPVGAQNVPLTAQRSLAVDRRFIPLGALLWLETTAPDSTPIQRLVVAQDVGGAIKGIVRGDFYWGSGKDDVLEQAGKMNAVGQYYIFLPKTLEVKDGQAQ